MTTKLVFVAFQPKSSDDYRAQEVCTDTTYHWNHDTTWGEGFETKAEAAADWESQNMDDCDDPIEGEECPEILEVGSEYDGLIEQMSHGLSLLDPDEFSDLCISEADEQLDKPVFFEHCPRGFANEVSFVAVDESRAEEYRDDSTYEELTRDELSRRMEHGAENHAEAAAAGVNTHQNPSSGSYGLEVISGVTKSGGTGC